MNIRARGILINGNKILLLRRVKNGHEYWTVPGGGVEDGETEKETVRREMKEETGLDVEVGYYVFESEFKDRISRHYLINSWKGELELGGPEKERMCEENQYYLEWIDLNDLKEKVYYPENLLEKI